MKVITKETNFLAKQKISSLVKYSECLLKYSTHFDSEISLKTKSPIFLDTNVLLRYYSISFTAREKLYDFINQNKERIILSSQVQYEFLNNREDVIQRFFEQVTNKIPKDFNADVVNKMKSFLELHKVVLKDYPFVETGIQKHQAELEELLNKLNETAEKKRKEYTDLIVKDKYLDLLNSCLKYDSLTNDELEIVKKDFDTLAKNISSETTESISNKSNIAFPGLGDIKTKPEDPYGNDIIYHEIMKFILNNSKDVIFLTFDNSKGDWMSKVKTPHLHYIQNMYSNTNQILYILDAERTLGELLNINIQSLVTSEIPGKIGEEISVESLEKLAETHKIFLRSRPTRIPTYIVDEIILAGYNSISEIERDLDKGILAYQEVIKDRGAEFNYIGTFRYCLRIVNPEYKLYIDPDGSKKEIIESAALPYSKYRDFIRK